MEYFLQQLINGLTLGSIYGLIAIGYTMVYGIVGMINFAHGDFAAHERAIANIREAEAATGRRVAIMGDLPGPKMRIGDLVSEPVELVRDLE